MPMRSCSSLLTMMALIPYLTSASPAWAEAPQPDAALRPSGLALVLTPKLVPEPPSRTPLWRLSIPPLRTLMDQPVFPTTRAAVAPGVQQQAAIPAPFRLSAPLLVTLGAQVVVSGLALGLIGMNRDSQAATVGGWGAVVLGSMLLLPGISLLVESHRAAAPPKPARRP